MSRLKNIHPGEILLEEYLIPLGISPYRLCKDLSIPQTRISEILKGRRSISADTALRLGRYLGTSGAFWLNLQNLYDLEEARLRNRRSIEAIKPFSLQKTTHNLSHA